jgi:hypothetical protein
MCCKGLIIPGLERKRINIKGINLEDNLLFTRSLE